MALPIRDALEVTRPLYKEEGEWQRFLIDSYTGCGGYLGRVKQPAAGFWGAAAEAYTVFAHTLGNYQDAFEVNTYLDRFPREDSVKFKRRRDVAHYLNYCRPITNLLVSYIVRKPHVRQEVPEKLKSLDREDQVRRRVSQARADGLGARLVPGEGRPPKAPEGALSRADTGDLEPYVVDMLPCNLRDYELDDEGAFVWAKLATTSVRRASWDAEAQEVTEYTVWTRAAFKVWEVSGESLKEIAEGSHDFGAVPVVSWRSSVSLDEHVKAASVIADIALEGRRLFNLINELDEHIRTQVFALLVVPAPAASPQGEASVDLGSNNGLSVDPEQKNLPMYLAPPASVAATLEARIVATVIEIYRMARVEYDRASGTSSSAQSKQQNFEQTNALLCDLADALADDDLETLRIVGRGLGESPEALAKMRCVAYTSYATEDIQMELEQAVAAITIPQLGREAHVQILQRLVRNLIPNASEGTLKTVDSEIEAAVDQAEKDAEAMKLAAQKALEKQDDEDGEGADGDSSDDDAGDADPKVAAE
jgi:hypothetical protein